MAKDDDKRLLDIFKERAVCRGEFILASGEKSSIYFDGRMVTLWPEGAFLIGQKIFHILQRSHIEAVGGMTMGADPIVTSVALVSYVEGNPIPAFIVRSKEKDHGTQKWIEGPLKAGSIVAIVDDVVTTGRSILRSIQLVEEHGCTVAEVVVVLDRQQGGSEEIRKRGYKFTSLLIVDKTGELKIAPDA